MLKTYEINGQKISFSNTSSFFYTNLYSESPLATDHRKNQRKNKNSTIIPFLLIDMLLENKTKATIITIYALVLSISHKSTPFPFRLFDIVISNSFSSSLSCRIISHKSLYHISATLVSINYPH